MATSRSARILVVDDDERLRSLLVLALQGAGFPVVPAADAGSAVAEVDKGGIDLVVLDVALGDADGRIILGKIREQGDVPVILISGQGDTADRVLGLYLGADDYLTKPFAPVELVARVETVLRRAARNSPADSGAAKPVPAVGIHVDEITREVHVDGKPVDLTAREFDLLAFLMRSPRQVFSRAQLLEHVWSSNTDWQDEATVTEHVRRLRNKIEPEPEHPRWVTTVRGVGYRFEP